MIDRKEACISIALFLTQLGARRIHGCSRPSTCVTSRIIHETQDETRDSTPRFTAERHRVHELDSAKNKLCVPSVSPDALQFWPQDQNSSLTPRVVKQSESKCHRRLRRHAEPGISDPSRRLYDTRGAMHAPKLGSASVTCMRHVCNWNAVPRQSCKSDAV
jgi:hypothetical protein